MDWIVEPQNNVGSGDQPMNWFCKKLCPGWLSIILYIGEKIYNCVDDDALCANLRVVGCD